MPRIPMTPWESQGALRTTPGTSGVDLQFKNPENYIVLGQLFAYKRILEGLNQALGRLEW